MRKGSKASIDWYWFVWRRAATKSKSHCGEVKPVKQAQMDRMVWIKREYGTNADAALLEKCEMCHFMISQAASGKQSLAGAGLDRRSCLAEALIAGLQSSQSDRRWEENMHFSMLANQSSRVIHTVIILNIYHLCPPHLWSHNIHAHLSSSSHLPSLVTVATANTTTVFIAASKIPIHWFERMRLQRLSFTFWSESCRRGRGDRPASGLHAYESYCLFLNSRFGCGSVNLTWSNSCNYVFGFSEIVTFSIRLVLKCARWHGVRIWWKYHCGAVLQSQNGPLLWPKTTTRNRKQSNWTDWLLFWNNKMWLNSTSSSERWKTNWRLAPGQFWNTLNIF